MVSGAQPGESDDSIWRIDKKEGWKKGNKQTKNENGLAKNKILPEIFASHRFPKKAFFPS